MRYFLFFLLSICMVFFFSCGRAKTEDPVKEKTERTALQTKKQSKSDELWRYLNSFKEKESMPSLEEIKDRFGKPIVPREWYLVPLFIIDEVVEKIKDGSIVNFSYEPSSGKLIGCGELIK